ncbi:hypothetical protein [Halorussus litoreus]|uniref:hypothetical protein n=1 Tax=Halorussus litoreus TaxID=1710536 RepID=UPI001300A008|nr:hypothetical protein [Halorussus litoreus]
MARDETARERDPEQALLGRAAHLQLADAAVATVAESSADNFGETTEGDDGDE